MAYRTEKKEGYSILWDEENKVGLRFQEGERLQRYTSAIVMDEAKIEEQLSTEEGVRHLNAISAKLTEEAEKLYPMEFAPMPD